MSSWLQKLTEVFAVVKVDRNLRGCQSINWEACQQPDKRTFSLSKINYNFPHFQQSAFFYITLMLPIYHSSYLLIFLFISLQSLIIFSVISI